MLRTSSLNLFYWLLGTYGELLTFKMVTGYCFQCVCAQITKVEVGEEDLLYLAFWTLVQMLRIFLYSHHEKRKRIDVCCSLQYSPSFRR